MISALAFCLILSACLQSRPQPAVSPPMSSMSTMAEQCTPRPDAVWRIWRGTSWPTAVDALLVEQETVWAGTSSGTFRIDPKSDVLMSAPNAESPSGVYRLFPLGNGRVWASNNEGHWYYDGQEWMPLQITGTVVSPSVIAIELNGDVLLETFVSRSTIRYRLPGHVPPPRYRLWEATREPVSSHWDPNECRFKTYISNGFSYRSQAECLALKQARQTVQEKIGQYAYVALDADRSIWWVAIPLGYTSPVLGHWSKGISTTFQLPVKAVNALAADRTRGIWLGTDKGLAYSDGKTLRWTSLGLGACTISATPYDVAIDSQGTVWLATSAGIQKLTRNELNWQSVMDVGLAGQEIFRPVRAIALAPDGGIWASHGYDLWRFGSSSTMSPIRVPDPTCQIEHLQVDVSGNVWGTSAHCGMWQFIPSANSGEWVHHNPDGPISSIVLSTAGDLYAAGDAGLFLFTATPSRNPTQVSLPWRWVEPSPRGNHVIAADKRNGVWIGSPRTGALWHYLSGDWIPIGDVFEKARLNNLHVDNQDQLWAEVGQALMINNGSAWRTITLPIAMTNRKLTSDPDGRIWIIGDEGVAVYNPAADKRP